MVQLPSYVERVLAGGRDLALVLLPLLNDLRAVRGSPLLSEGTLLLLNLKSDQQAAPVAPDAGEPAAHGRAVGAPAAHALPARPRRLDPRRAPRTEPRNSRNRRAPARAGGHPAVRVPALVGGRRHHRSVARRRPRNRRLGQATARSRRSRNPAALHAGRRRVIRRTRRSSC